MTSQSLPSIASGHEYLVVQVGASELFVLDDLLGESELILEGAGQRHTITGVGAASPTGVRFFEKDPGRHGRDVRTWRISRNDQNVVTAVHDPAI